MNARPVDVLRGSSFAPTPWRDVRVGDVVRVRDRDAFPADLVLLSSSATASGGGRSGGGNGNGGDVDPFPLPPAEGSTAGDRGDQASCPSPGFPTGVAFVETANLDGETNLKMRQALQQTAGLLSAAAVCRATTGSINSCGVGLDGGASSSAATAASASASTSASSSSSPPPSPSRSSLLRIECEQPNSAIYRFQGVLVTPEGERLPLSPNQVRGKIIYLMCRRRRQRRRRRRRKNQNRVASPVLDFPWGTAPKPCGGCCCG